MVLAIVTVFVMAAIVVMPILRVGRLCAGQQRRSAQDGETNGGDPRHGTSFAATRCRHRAQQSGDSWRHPGRFVAGIITFERGFRWPANVL
jgi:hypothetical protein